MDSVQITMQKVARSNAQAADLDGISEIHHMRVGVRNRNAAGEDLVGERLDSLQVTDGAIGQAGYAAQGARDPRVSFSQKRSHSRCVVGVLDYQDSRSGDTGKVFPKIRV